MFTIADWYILVHTFSRDHHHPSTTPSLGRISLPRLQHAQQDHNRSSRPTTECLGLPLSLTFIPCSAQKDLQSWTEEYIHNRRGGSINCGQIYVVHRDNAAYIYAPSYPEVIVMVWIYIWKHTIGKNFSLVPQQIEKKKIENTHTHTHNFNAL